MNLQHCLLAGLLLSAPGWGALAQTIETHSFLKLNRAIPDGNVSGLSDHQTVASAINAIAGLRVKLHLAGEYNGDLYGYVRLVSTSSTNFCVLLNRVGRTAADPWGYDDSGLNVTLDDAAANGNIHVYQGVTIPPAGTPLTGSWRPDGRDVDPSVVVDTSPSTTSLTTFNGSSPSGDWTLFLADVDSGATNLLVSWELEISGGRVPDVTWPTPAAIVYGTALSGTQLNASSSVAGTFAYAPPAGTILNAGAAQTLSVTFTPTDLITYVPVTTSVPIQVLQKDLTITAADSSKVYGAALPTFSATYTGFVAGDTVSSLDTPVTLSTTATASSPAGTYPVSPGGATDANYAIAFVNGTLNVTKAGTTGLITASANPATPGQSVTFTMQVTAVAPGAGTPTGTVQFLVDGANTGAPAPLSGAIAALSLTTLTAGLHTVRAAYPGDGNFIGTTNTLAQPLLINTVPLAGADTIQRYPTDGTKVLVSTLLSNDADADGNAFQLISVSPTSAHGGTLTRDGDWVHYTPAPGFTDDDSFTYTIEDSYNAHATATVTVRATTDAVPSPNLVVTDLGNGSFLLSFDGIPGKTYRIQFTENLDTPLWSELGSQTADDFGMFEYTDTPPPAAPVRFYRSVYP